MRLGELAAAVRAASELSSRERGQILDGINAITAQLASPGPDKRLVSRLWDAVNVAATISGAAGIVPLAQQITRLLTQVIG